MNYEGLPHFYGIESNITLDCGKVVVFYEANHQGAEYIGWKRAKILVGNQDDRNV